MKNPKKNSSSSAPRISDARFANFQTDPRFRLPSKKQTKTTIDKRFARMLKDDEFTATAKVDRYGRKLKSDNKKKALQRLYQEEGEEDENEGESKEKDQADEDEDDGLEEDLEVDDDEIVQRELRAAHEKYDPARGGGFSSSDSESSSDSDSDSDDEEEGGVGIVTKGVIQKLQDEQAEVQTGDVSKRIAVVNLDWDHVNSTDLMALFSSFLPTISGRIEKVSVYPSEFGKERMKQEETEGPPKELFKNEAREDSDDSSDDDSEAGDEKIKKQLMQEGDDQDFDSDALRAYQLDRLRYYYAVVVCSDKSTAQKIYESTDGTEYQSSSNFLDLRFVPDDVTFDDEPRDECNKVPEAYKPIEFVTNALQSSKVKLTWDLHPEEVARKESINRAFSGSRAELEENDLRAYLASDSEDEDNNGDDDEKDDDAADVADEQPKLSKKELARRKMREALGLTDETSGKTSKDALVGDMQITFTPALSESKPKAKDPEEETTIEKYKRKERERKEKKRQKAKAKREGLDLESEEDQPEEVAEAEVEGDDLGFDDPFFTTENPAPSSKTSIRKEERRKKREAREAAEEESAVQRAHLTKVMAEDANENQAEHLDHFNMNEIMRMEKQKRKKLKGKKKQQQQDTQGGLQEDFTMDVGDDRFKAVFDSHEFAIDPSNPKFKGTEGMKQLLEEGRRKRRAGDDDNGGMSKKVKKGRR